MRGFVFCLLPIFAIRPILAQTACENVQLQLAPDYSFAIGSSSGGSAFTLTVDGKAVTQGPLTQTALFHYDGSLTSTFGLVPSTASGVAYDTAKFGKGVYLQPAGGLAYPSSVFNVSEGTVEMWIAPRYNGNDPAFATAGYSIFFYVSNGDYVSISENPTSGGRIINSSASAKESRRMASHCGHVFRERESPAFLSGRNQNRRSKLHYALGLGRIDPARLHGFYH